MFNHSHADAIHKNCCGADITCDGNGRIHGGSVKYAAILELLITLPHIYTYRGMSPVAREHNSIHDDDLNVMIQSKTSLKTCY